ncbi:hypothetical protein [Streptomyces venezuelae]
MRAIRVASAALLTASALALSAPAASAAAVGEENVTAFGFSITPKTVAAGGQVTLNVDGCDDGDTKVTSGVFDDTTIPKGQKSATAHVFWDAKPGAMYEVTFTCNGSNPGSDKTDLTIATGRPDNNSHHNQHNQHNQHNKGVKAGIGGSLGGLDLHEIALGSALILGTLGTAYYKARRRTGEDNS